MWIHPFSLKYSENSLAEFRDRNKHDTTFIASWQASNNTWGDVMFSCMETGRILFPRITRGLRLKTPLDILWSQPPAQAGTDFWKSFCEGIFSLSTGLILVSSLPAMHAAKHVNLFSQKRCLIRYTSPHSWPIYY